MRAWIENASCDVSRYKVVLAALTLVCLSFSREHHGTISSVSFGLLAQQGVIVKNAYRDAFIKGSMHEDNKDQLLRKLFNQHFYRKGWEPACGMSTCVRRFEHLASSLQKAISRKDRSRAWYLAGMMAHYLQDMNCPPHVVPIYHLNKDSFDQAPLPEHIQLDQMLLDEWGHTAPRVLLDTLSMITYRSIREPLEVSVNDKPERRDWSFFWSSLAAKQHPTFGHYGVAGNAWGQETFHCIPHGGRAGNTCKDSTTEYRVLRVSYLKYRTARVNTACTATAALIQYVINGLAKTDQ